MRMKERILEFRVSDRKGKKYRALLQNIASGATRILHFGGLGYQQYQDRTPLGAFSYLDHGERRRMQNYFSRHSGTRNRARAIKKEKILSDGFYTPKILSHEFLW